jgi:uncharacterized protein
VAPAPLQLGIDDARRLAVLGQMLSAPQPTALLDVVRHLGGLQMDPTAAVARSEQLVLWSRLGSYDLAELERLLYETGELFEYWAYIVPTSDYALHRETMRRYPRGELSRARYIREWLAANTAFRSYVLRELRRRGPLRSRDLEDRAAVPWRTGGWNDGKSLGRMLDILWFGGRIAIVGRDGSQRVYDLAERRLPVDEPRLPAAEVARRVLDNQLRWRGIARPDQFGSMFDGHPPGRELALLDLVAAGRAIPATVDGLPGPWYAHAEVLERKLRPRTTLLSPFDKLISNRERTEELFGFRFRLEIYVPKATRRHGYFVLPILHGERLVGRIDPLFDRATGMLRLNAVHWEPDAPSDVPLEETVTELAAWLGAEDVAWP